MIEAEEIPIDLKPFEDLVGSDVVTDIFERAPRKVRSRVAKAADHFAKALKLSSVDDEMGAIRCIAAEEELVVAIFEWLKLNGESMPEHRDFLRMRKNHQVKLAFYPVLSQFRFVLGNMVEYGITLDGLGGYIDWTLRPVLDPEGLRLEIAQEDGSPLIRVNPLYLAINWNDGPDDEVLDELFADFERIVREQHDLSLREFVMVRADYRNKLLYAEDAGSVIMAEALDELIEQTFSVALRDLLWVLAALLGNQPSLRNWGLVSQFVTLYRRVLVEAKVLRP